MSELDDLLNPPGFRANAAAQGLTLQRALYEALKRGIVQGRLLPGAGLPGSRELAQELGMGRNGVVHAYEQLAAEGHVQSSRQGTVVAALSLGGLRPPNAGAAAVRQAPLSRRTEGCHRVRDPAQEWLPFMPGIPALDAFPIALWDRLMGQARRHSGADALCYRDPAGEPELRQAIATYLRAARGVHATADQVFITDGTQQALDLCARLLADVGDTAWIEHPGYGGARMALLQAGLRLQPVTVDADGIHPPDAWWTERTPRLVYTTPSHQYPLGPTLTLARRVQLIERARRHGCWLIEDDYDSEFRHDGPPLAAMQGQALDAPVVYLGTFSKTVFPALRLGFMVLPASVAGQAAGVIGAWASRGHAIEQRALASFIEEGHFTRHLRRMRRLYRERLAALREALAIHWPWPGEVLGAQAGMHLVLPLPDELPDHALCEAALLQGLSPRPLTAYGTGGIGGFNGLVLGYANTPAEAMVPHVRTLAGVARSLA